MSIETYLRAIPKVELHVHLEGAIQPKTLLTLAERNGIDLPGKTPAELQDFFTFRDFPHFADVYVLITTCLRREEDYTLIAQDFGAEMARQNIRYAEVTFSPSTHRWLGVSDNAMLDGLERGRQIAREEHGVEIQWVFDIVRWKLHEKETMARADYTTDLAISAMDRGVVALGLGGIEAGHPPEDFEPWFDRGRAAGLRSAPHAGEFGGPESVRGALDRLGAERIGHGVNAIADPALVKRLAESRIPLEVSPTSNVRLGVVQTFNDHAFRPLREAGVLVTVNSDDPPLFNTTFNDEVVLLRGAFGYSITEIEEILLDAVRSTFLPAERRAEMESAFRAEMALLRAEHLGD